MRMPWTSFVIIDITNYRVFHFCDMSLSIFLMDSTNLYYLESILNKAFLAISCWLTTVLTVMHFKEIDFLCFSAGVVAVRNTS